MISMRAFIKIIGFEYSDTRLANTLWKINYQLLWHGVEVTDTSPSTSNIMGGVLYLYSHISVMESILPTGSL